MKKVSKFVDYFKEVQIVYRLFLVNCYLLHVILNYAQPASNVGGLVIHWTTVDLASQYIGVTRNNLCIISISLEYIMPKTWKKP